MPSIATPYRKPLVAIALVAFVLVHLAMIIRAGFKDRTRTMITGRLMQVKFGTGACHRPATYRQAHAAAIERNRMLQKGRDSKRRAQLLVKNNLASCSMLIFQTVPCAAAPQPAS